MTCPHCQKMDPELPLCMQERDPLIKAHVHDIGDIEIRASKISGVVRGGSCGLGLIIPGLDRPAQLSMSIEHTDVLRKLASAGLIDDRGGL